MSKQRPLVAPAAVRRWAKLHGYTIGERGRLPAALTEAYLADYYRRRVTENENRLSPTR